MGVNNATARQWFTALLDTSSNSARLDAITFHEYASCHNTTAAGLEPIFPNTVARLLVLQAGNSIGAVHF